MNFLLAQILYFCPFNLRYIFMFILRLLFSDYILLLKWLLSLSDKLLTHWPVSFDTFPIFFVFNSCNIKLRTLEQNIIYEVISFLGALSFVLKVMLKGEFDVLEPVISDSIFTESCRIDDSSIKRDVQNQLKIRNFNIFDVSNKKTVG